MPFYYNFFIAAIVFVYGTIIGSFLNVVIYRTPKKEQVVKGRSHCMTCQHTLAWYDLFPVLSWVLLAGKCRYCRTKISGRYALVESLCGVSYAIGFLALGFSVSLIFAVILIPILICLSFFDIDTGEIEYWCPISIGILGAVTLGLSLFGVVDTVWYTHLIGAVIIAVPFAVLCFFGAMGGGDVQLMFAAGLLLGWNIIPAAFIGIFLGAIIGIIHKVKNKPVKERMVDDDSPALEGTPLRFGPFLSIGIFAAFLCGEQMIEWYLRVMGIS